MHDDPIDLTPLDPDADPGAEERFVGAVMSRIATRANPYPVKVDALWGAWSLARPVLIAASVVIVVAGVLAVRAARETGARPLTVADAVGVPPEFLYGAIPVTEAPAR
jgi:anti-sigma-K factor RskA